MTFYRQGNLDLLRVSGNLKVNGDGLPDSTYYTALCFRFDSPEKPQLELEDCSVREFLDA